MSVSAQAIAEKTSYGLVKPVKVVRTAHEKNGSPGGMEGLMPNAYTHQLIAEDALEEIGGIADLPSFYLGAQGGDPMFFYRFISMRGGMRPGKLLHRERIYDTFSAVAETVRTCPECMDYALGYISHYAADTVFHPYIYWLAQTKGGTRMDRNIIHTRAERDLDTYFLFLRGKRMHEYRLPLCRKNIDIHVMYTVMSAALSVHGVEIAESNIRRALGSYFRFIRNTYDKTGVRRHISDALGRIGIKPFTLLGALFSRPYYNDKLLNADRNEWYYVSDPSLILRDSADDLYARAVKRTVELCGIFRYCVTQNKPLPEELFSRSFIKGL